MLILTTLCTFARSRNPTSFTIEYPYPRMSMDSVANDSAFLKQLTTFDRSTFGNHSRRFLEFVCICRCPYSPLTQNRWYKWSKKDRTNFVRDYSTVEATRFVTFLLELCEKLSKGASLAKDDSQQLVANIRTANTIPGVLMLLAAAVGVTATERQICADFLHKPMLKAMKTAIATKATGHWVLLQMDMNMRVASLAEERPRKPAEMGRMAFDPESKDTSMKPNKPPMLTHDFDSVTVSSPNGENSIKTPKKENDIPTSTTPAAQPITVDRIRQPRSSISFPEAWKSRAKLLCIQHVLAESASSQRQCRNSAHEHMPALRGKMRLETWLEFQDIPDEDLPGKVEIWKKFTLLKIEEKKYLDIDAGWLKRCL